MNFSMQLSQKKMSPEEYVHFKEDLREEVLGGNPTKALQELRKASYDGRVGQDCHNLTHEIGHAAYEKYKDTVVALQYKEYVCGYGYIHGVIESALLEDPHALEKMSTLCHLYTEKRDELECYHGAGHTLMILSGNDLPESIKKCSIFSSQDGKIACGTGVFMENFSADSDHPSEYLDAADPFFPCGEVDSAYKAECYRMAPIFYLRLHQNDFSHILAWCNEAEQDFRLSCTRGATQSFTQYTNKLHDIEYFCLLGTVEQQVMCMDEVVRLGLQSLSRDQMQQVCINKISHEMLQGACMHAVQVAKIY